MLQTQRKELQRKALRLQAGWQHGKLGRSLVLQVPGSPKPGTSSSWLTGTLSWQHQPEDG